MVLDWIPGWEKNSYKGHLGPHGENADVMCALGNIAAFVFTFQNATT